MRIDLIVAGALVAAVTVSGTTLAAPIPVSGARLEQTITAAAPASFQSPDFRRCMRAKYGPKYFSRVPRAHRWHMSQACL